MANLTDNLILFKNGKQKIIDEVNTKLQDKDKEELDIDCEWDDINELMSKIVVKKDRSSELDANEIYTQICSDTRNESITTNVTTIGAYSLYNQSYLPELIAEKCTSIGDYALSGCSALTSVSIPECTTIGNNAFTNTTSLEEINLPKATSIGSYAFDGSGIKTATLDVATTLTLYCFRSTKLTTVTAPNVTIISQGAFTNCTSLETINCADNITVGTSAFSGCTLLKDDIFDKVKSVSDSSFAYCTSLLTVDSEKITTLSTRVFYGCTSLETVNLPNCTSLNYYQVFFNNTALKSLILPSITTIGTRTWNTTDDFAINTCNSLESLYIPAVTTAYNVCAYCNSLTAVSLPSITSNAVCGKCLFYTCNNLKSIDIANAIVLNTYGSNSDDSALFYELPKLESLNLSSLKYVYSDISTYYNSNNYRTNYLCYRCGFEELSLPSLQSFNPYYGGFIAQDCRNLKKLNLPALQYCIEWNSYGLILAAGCPNLTEINLPELTTVQAYRLFCCANYNYNYATYIGFNSFDDKYQCKAYLETYCNAIKEKYPDTYKTNSDFITYYERLNGGTIDGTLENAAPYNTGYKSARQYNMVWSGLKVVKLPKLTKWTNGWSMFDHCTELEEIWLGNGSTEATSTLDSYFTYSCYNLKRIVLNYTNVITASTALTTIFYDSTYFLNGSQKSFTYNSKTYYYVNETAQKMFYIYVPDDLVDSYKSATNWSTYADFIKPISELAALNIDSSITEVTESEYKDDQTLTTVAGYGIEKVDNYGFYNTSMTDILIPKCTSLGNYAFANSNKLNSIAINSITITDVGKYAYSNTAITSISLPKMTEILEGTFKDCTALATCTLDTVKVIDTSAFENTALVSISYSTLLRVGKQAFKNCTNLSTATLPIVTSIENEAFMNDVISILSLPLVTTIKADAFNGNKLTSVSIPKIAVIGDSAFANNTDLTSINLYEASVIGNNVFDGCTSLTDITFTGYSVPTCGNLPTSCTLHVKSSMIDDFKTAFPENTIVGDVE